MTNSYDRGNLFAKERQDNIVGYINRAEHASVNELASFFGVSIATIRNDLNYLAERGLIKRSHGGASSIGKNDFSVETSIYERSASNVRQKETIARKSLQLINDGDTIAILAGTTLFELTKLLGQKSDLTIVVNDLQIASWLNENTNHRIYVLGGFIRNKFHYMNFDTSYIESINVDKAFFSTTGFDLNKGAMVPDINLASTERCILNKANQLILLCDSSKFHKTAFVKVVDTNSIDYIITDSGISDEDRETLNSHKGLELIVAD